MFNPFGGGMPPRSRAEARRMRELGRRNFRFPMGPMEDPWMPTAHDFMNPPFMSPNWPPLPSPFEIMPDPTYTGPIHCLGPPSSSGIDYRGEIFEEFEESLPLTTTIIPFERAAAMLNDAIDTTIRFCKQIESQFDSDMSSILVWADPKDIDALWVKRLEWNGNSISGQAEQGRESGTSGQSGPSSSSSSSSTKMSYNVVMANLYRAIDELKMSDAVRELRVDEVEHSAQGPERVRTALNKLFVTFEGIEELVDTVRTNRSRMSALDKELNAAKNLLHETRDLWMQHRGGAERRQGVGGGFGRLGPRVMY